MSKSILVLTSLLLYFLLACNNEKGEMKDIEEVIVSPPPDTVILEKDILILIGDKDFINKIQKG